MSNSGNCKSPLPSSSYFLKNIFTLCACVGSSANPVRTSRRFRSIVWRLSASWSTVIRGGGSVTGLCRAAPYMPSSGSSLSWSFHADLMSSSKCSSSLIEALTPR